MASTRLYRLDHCTYLCQYHIVWICKYRSRVLTDRFIKAELKRIFKQVCRWKDFIPLAWHIGEEHVHLHLIIPPKYSVAYAICVLKSKSSGWLKKKTKKLPQGSLWARGYFVSTVGINEMAIRKYIEHQRHNQVELPKLPLQA